MTTFLDRLAFNAMMVFVLTGREVEVEPQPRPVDDTDAWRGFEPTE